MCNLGGAYKCEHHNGRGVNDSAWCQSTVGTEHNKSS